MQLRNTLCKLKSNISVGKRFAAVFFTTVFTVCLCGDGLDAKAATKDLDRAAYCSFIVPAGFNPCDIPGLYVNEHYPLESANISYSVTEIPQEKVLTNAQKAAGESASVSDEEILYDELTGEMYEEIQGENYKQLYGENIGFTVEKFEEYLTDGYPGYRINTSFTPENSQTIHQKISIVLSSNKIFTIVYSRADDDDFEDAFTESVDSIHVKASFMK